MSIDTSDKEMERRRYERTAGELLHEGTGPRLVDAGSQGVPEELRAPYLKYEQRVRECLRPGMDVLEVCAGTGLHSLTAVGRGAKVTLTDISASALRVAELRAAERDCAVTTVTADAESLPFPPASFDVVLCAGGLSYMDRGIFFDQLRRVLRSGGCFVAVDSFNHNPIYRLNRWWHFLRGHRTRSTLQRMPDEALLQRLGGMFEEVSVWYFGTLAFTVPLMRLFLSPAKTSMWLERTDHVLVRLRRHAFKVVIHASKPRWSS